MDLYFSDGNGTMTPTAFLTQVVDDNNSKDPLNVDAHWRPQIAICPFCNKNKFKIYGRYENLVEDTAYILMKSNLTHLMEIGKINKSPRKENISNNERSELFWSNVDGNIIQQLYEIYEMDFKMFDYT